ncbi:MAG TPA: glycosyltransferase family 4 protein [Pyrinomonadaceae bacterium]|nr:glycosyltransferase family 4 protein [Pyrinomonadaceae bacterium]
MRVLALIPNQKGYSPGQRGSIELWEKILTPAGIEVVYEPFETELLRSILYKPGHYAQKAVGMIKAYADRIQLVRDLDHFDAVFVYREAALLGPAFLERMIARKKPIIYQLDDPLFVPYRSPSNGLLSYLKFFGKIKRIVQISTAVIVNSTPILEFASPHNSNIWQVPSVVDTDKFTYDERDQLTDPPCIGWSGSQTTVKNIKMVEEVLRHFSREGSCRISLIGSDDFGLTNVNHTAKKWDAETEVDELRKIHIGLVPLPDDNPWNPYKFIMKTAQYMALGIVPVGTSMASNTEVIRHGENGFLADTEAEWIEYLSRLVHDRELRLKLSRAAVIDAAAKYSLQANAQKIIAAFRSVSGNQLPRASARG